ncbi:hypothetical protein [Novosphingobium kaempferiae]|uniref:hypothetical protein n=1 Tax=Novosphingobium kaempferiae TaxID=2896849 RepID=UPI001E4F9A41|nr:hypothetical protein [Novosphingobium kaempferiae]
MDLIEHAARALAYERTSEDWDDLPPMLQECLKRDERTVLTALLDAAPDLDDPGEKLVGDDHSRSADSKDIISDGQTMTG